MPVMTTMPTTAPNASAASNPLLAQAQQIAIQQQLAGALLGKSLQDYSPTVAGPSGNPFARSTVNYGDIISQIANSLGGHALLNQIGPEQLQLAQLSHDIQAQDTSGVVQALEGGQVGVPGPDGSTPATVAGDPLQAIKLAGQSYSPAVNAIGNSLLQTWLEGQLKSVVDAGQIGTLTRNSTGPSVLSALTPGPFGMRMGNPGALTPYLRDATAGNTVSTWSPLSGQFISTLQPPVRGASISTPVGTTTTPGMPGNVINYGSSTSTTGSGTAPGSGNTPATTDNSADVQTSPLAPQPKITPEAASAALGSAIVQDPSGKITMPQTPSSEAQSQLAKEQQTTLEEGRTQGQGFNAQLPNIIGMLKLIPQSDLGLGKDWLLQARRALISAGVSQDDANQVVNTQTYLKAALTQTTHFAREFNSRTTQLELMNFMKALGATQDIDPGTAKNLMINQIVDGVNNNVLHNRNIAKFSSNPVLGGAASQYSVPGFPSMPDVMDMLDKAHIAFHIAPQPGESSEKTLSDGWDPMGLWQNMELGMPTRQPLTTSQAAAMGSPPDYSKMSDQDILKSLKASGGHF